MVVAQEVPTSSSMAVPHGPAGVGEARHRMREQLRGGGVAESVIDDAVLILSELLSNACKHGRPLGGALTGDGAIRAAWGDVPGPQAPSRPPSRWETSSTTRLARGTTSSQRASTVKYHISPRWMPFLNRQCSCSGIAAWGFGLVMLVGVSPPA